MFRLVVLCACFAAASAGLLHAGIPTPLAYNAAIPYGPATTYISPTAYSQIGLSPAGFQPIGLSGAPVIYSHLKKRSVPEQSPGAEAEDAEISSDADIKKRSAILANYYPTTYATAPYVPTSFPAAVYPSTYSYISAPLAYPTHLIKKRSAALTYAAPAAISHQSRIDYSSPIIQSYAGAAPIGYPFAGQFAYAGAPFGYASSFIAPNVAL